MNQKRLDMLNDNVENLRKLIFNDRETTQRYLYNLSERIASVQ